MTWIQRKEGIQEKLLKNKEIWQHIGQRRGRRESRELPRSFFGFEGLEGCWCVCQRWSHGKGLNERGAGDDDSVMDISLKRQ